MARLTVLGGSSVSSVGLALALRRAAADRPLTLVLQGRSRAKLDVVAKACRIALSGSDIGLEAHTDLDEALSGATLVLNQIRVGGLEGRRFDESFPRTLGLVAEETLGAGGFSNALRTVPVVLELARAIEAAAPDAHLVNLTNPASVVQQALDRFTGLSSLSVCDVPVTLHGWVSGLLELPRDEVVLDYAGTNHIGWATGARDASGAERLPEALARLERLPAYPFPPEWPRALGVLPGPYLRYFHSTGVRNATPGGPTRADQLLDVEADLLGAYAALGADATAADAEQIVARRAPHWYDEIVVPVLEALLSPTPRRLIVQIANRGRDARLSDHQTVEVPALVSRGGVAAETPAALPPDCRALLEQNAAYEELALDAIVERDRGKALRALVVNPLVGSVDDARAVLDAVWDHTASATEGVR